MTKSPNVKELIGELRTALSDLNSPDELELLASDDTLVRFLKSRNWDVRASETMLRKTVVWRREFRPQEVRCDYCSTNPGAHTLRQIGFDEAQRPVIYASFYPAHPSQRNTTAEVLTHLIYVIENAIRSMRPGVCQWVFVVDCAGMTHTACHPRLGYQCAQVMANHYPERLGLAICTRPGPVFRAAWQTIKPFLSSATAKKVLIVNSKSQLQSVMEKYFSPSLSQWIMDEYKSNRSTPVVKRYRPFWKPQPDVNHDPRGDAYYVDAYINTRHPCGHLPHPSMIDYAMGKIPSILSLPIDEGDGHLLEDDPDGTEMDEAAAQKLLASLPTEFQIPTDAEKLG